MQGNDMTRLRKAICWASLRPDMTGQTVTDAGKVCCLAPMQDSWEVLEDQSLKSRRVLLLLEVVLGTPGILWIKPRRGRKVNSKRCNRACSVSLVLLRD